jgi:hypothetical protein
MSSTTFSKIEISFPEKKLTFSGIVELVQQRVTPNDNGGLSLGGYVGNGEGKFFPSKNEGAVFAYSGYRVCGNLGPLPSLLPPFSFLPPYPTLPSFLPHLPTPNLPQGTKSKFPSGDQSSRR